MKRTTAVLAAALTTAGVVGVIAPGTASAHHPVITVDTDCGDDGWTATYTVNADADRDFTWSVNGEPFQPDETPFTFVVPKDYTDDTDSFVANAEWSNGVESTRTADADRPQGCTPPLVEDPCDPSTYNGSVEAKITETGEQCVDLAHTVECGSFSATITQNDTPYAYGVSYSVGSLAYNFDTDATNVSFAEDENGGSVDVWYWAVGPESGFFTPLGLPWYDVSARGPITVDTDCEEPPVETTEPPVETTEPPVETTEPPVETTEPPVETTEPPIATTEPPVETTEPPANPAAEVTCVSTGPDYVSWQLANTGDIAIVSPLSLAPGETGVLESLSTDEGSVTVTVVFSNDATMEITGSGDGCVFTTVPPTDPPVTDPPATTQPPATTTEPPATTEPPSTTAPGTIPVDPSPPTTDPGTPIDPPDDPRLFEDCADLWSFLDPFVEFAPGSYFIDVSAETGDPSLGYLDPDGDGAACERTVETSPFDEDAALPATR